MPITLPEHEIRAWLRLTLERGLGPARVRRLLAVFGLPQNIYFASTDTLLGLLGPELSRRLKLPPDQSMAAALDATMHWLAEPDHHLLTLADPGYPAMLLNIYDPPILLYIKGNPSFLSRSAIAVVGARNASPAGLDHAKAFSRYLAEHGWCIVSGMASGIDAAAHHGALLAGPNGAGTIAVLGTGIDVVYPTCNRKLARQIASDGALVSEFPLGAQALARHFPRRNRIVAGMTHGVLIVEAAKQSGSLITAKLALEAGREVFAIPGSIHSPLARGCHALIRQGAKLVESGQDIHDELGNPPPPPSSLISEDPCFGKTPRAHMSSNEQRSRPKQPELQMVLEAIGHDPTHIDLLSQRTGLALPALTVALLQLELDEHVLRLTDGRYQSRTPPLS